VPCRLGIQGQTLALPLLTGYIDNVIVMPSFMLYFITFIYTSLVLRRMLL